MRILQIITRMDSIGGAQRHLVDVCLAAHDAGHDVHLAYGGECALDEEELRGVHLYELANLRREVSPIADFAASRELLRLIKKLKPDLVATHSTKAGILGRLAATLAKVCNVHTIHGWSVNFSGNRIKRFVYRQIESKVHRFAHGLICVCEYDFQHALKLGLERDRLVVIYNGRPDVSNVIKVKEASECVRIVSIGRMAWPKQPEQLLRFLQGRANIQLDLLGDGPRESEIMKLADDLGVRGQVVFHGHVHEIDPILARGDVFALVSDWEGFPMSTLEAMAAGLPTVVSDVGGASEAIEDGVTGFVIPRGNEGVLHQRLSELMEDGEKRRELGKQARDLYLRKFKLEAMIEKTLAFYDEIVRNHSN